MPYVNRTDRRFKILTNDDFEIIASFNSMAAAEEYFSENCCLYGEHILDSETGKVIVGSLPFLD